MTGEVRECKHCGEVKPLTDEHFRVRIRDGRTQYECRACNKRRQQQWHQRRQAGEPTNAYAVQDGLKPCRGCRQMLPATDEYFRTLQCRGRMGKLHGRCRPCEKAKQAEYRSEPGFQEARSATNKRWAEKRKRDFVLVEQPDQVKVCTACGSGKAATLENFVPCATSPDGFYARCRPCFYAASRQSEARNATGKKYRARHRLRLNERSRNYYWENREEIRARERERRKDPDVLTAIKAHNHKRRAQKLGAPGSFSREDVQLKYQMQGGNCYYCGEPITEMHMEHKIPLSRGGTNWPANICLSCKACNLSKHTKTSQEFKRLRANQ